MQIAVNSENNRISADRAEKGQEYFCPICKKEVVLKKGEINIPHFAHKTLCDDKWHYDMSEWHYGMQQRFPEEQREVVVTHNGQIHRADILCGKQVIEFQHSEISAEEIEERTKFYTEAGYDIAWVFDVQEQYDNQNIMCTDEEYLLANEYRWKYAKRCLQALPFPSEEDRKVVVYLYWIDESEMENFNRIIRCQRGTNNQPDYSIFLTPNSPSVYTENDKEELNVGNFFLTRSDVKNNYLKIVKSEYNCNLSVKYSGVKGLRRHNYECPKSEDSSFLSVYDKKHGCFGCKHCAAIYYMEAEERYKNRYKALEIYCSYPDISNEPTMNMHNNILEYKAKEF